MSAVRSHHNQWTDGAWRYCKCTAGPLLFAAWEEPNLYVWHHQRLVLARKDVMFCHSCTQECVGPRELPEQGCRRKLMCGTLHCCARRHPRPCARWSAARGRWRGRSATLASRPSSTCTASTSASTTFWSSTHACRCAPLVLFDAGCAPRHYMTTQMWATPAYVPISQQQSYMPHSIHQHLSLRQQSLGTQPSVAVGHPTSGTLDSDPVSNIDPDCH